MLEAQITHTDKMGAVMKNPEMCFTVTQAQTAEKQDSTHAEGEIVNEHVIYEHKLMEETTLFTYFICYKFLSSCFETCIVKSAIQIHLNLKECICLFFYVLYIKYYTLFYT